MRLLFTLDRKDYAPEAPVYIRPSARGILIWQGKVALIHSAKYGYYKFPGGGIEAGEDPVDAMIREVAEEAGLRVIPDSIREYGLVHRVEKGDRGETFVQDNYYYLCAFDPEPISRHLDAYEAEEGFALEFVAPEAAISENRGSTFESVMLEREARVLEMLLSEGYFS